MKHPLSADEGMQALLRQAILPQTEVLPLFSAQDRVLAQTLTARIPVPPFAKSPFDGYAFRSADTVLASPAHPVTLQITEELPAGAVPTRPVLPGTAAKILTGAAVPEGADAIIKYELTSFTPETVTLTAPCSPGNIIAAGEDVRAGDILAETGTRITGPVMGVLAGQGVAEATVYRRPVVSLISTGSELVPVGAPLSPGSIYSTNLFTIGGLLREMGVEVLDGGLVRDDLQALTERIESELSRADMVITTGGASVGDYDYTEAAFLRLGAGILFKKLRFKPGGAMLAAAKDGKVLLGLSGNPGAAAIGLLRVASPYIRKLCGRNDLFYEEITLALKQPLKKASPKMRFLRGHLAVENGAAFFVENRSQGNGSVSSLLRCNLLAEIPAESPPLETGTLVKAYRITL